MTNTHVILHTHIPITWSLHKFSTSVNTLNSSFGEMRQTSKKLTMCSSRSGLLNNVTNCFHEFGVVKSAFKLPINVIELGDESVPSVGFWKVKIVLVEFLAGFSKK